MEKKCADNNGRISAFAIVTMAARTFQFTPDFTLWSMTWQGLNAMFSELNYMQDPDNDEKKSLGSELDAVRNIPGIKID